jgi:hypothetical protein
MDIPIISDTVFESFGLIGIQLPEKYKENFDVQYPGL